MYRKNPQGWLKHIDFILLDLLCLNLAFLLAYVSRNGLSNPYGDSGYRSILIVFMLVDLLVLVFFDTLKDVLKRGYYQEFAVTVKHVLLVEVIVAFYLFSIQDSVKYSRIVFYLLAFYYIVLTYLVRIIWKKILQKKQVLAEGRSLFLVTTGDMAEKLVGGIASQNRGIFHIAGIALLDADLTGQAIGGIEVKANASNLVEYLCREWVDEVFLSIPESEPYPRELISQLTEMGITVHMEMLKTSELTGLQQFVEKIGNYTVLTISINTATVKQTAIKRILDILGGLVGCLITVILSIVIGPLIYLKSPGPIFFSQVRVGKNGKKFKMYKFRSMYMDAEERKKELMAQNRVKDGMMFKLDWDPRIIGSKKLPDGTVKKGIGNYIRDWSLDEFPQFFNVLKGDMSLVGTRPPTVDEWEKYELHHRARLAMKPGITGMWQVSGRSNITDFEEVVKLDKKYITEWSMGLDFKILLKTVGAVFGKDGAM